MAASASRASSTYDVFLSFRGADTRKGFTDHLYNALVREGIHTFRDDDEIKSGTEIGPECLKAIEESRFSIVILSKGYASSTWCLDELVHILECRDRHGHVVWPVFYNVDPSEVEEVRGSFEEAFAGHQECFREAMEKVERWKCALKEVAYLKGLDLQRHFDGHEAKNIDFIVKEISRRLDRTMLSVAAHPVGLNSRANHVISLVADESVDVGMVGIYGMGGIGKTTIAKEVYNSIFRNFDGCCFLENVRQRSVDKGITYLQRQLLTEILKAKHEKIDTADRGQNIISERLRRKRVLLVLDDVDKLEQLNKILGNGSWLYSGSRVIITTRIRGLLPPSSKLYQQYEVPALDFGDSLQLLSKHAFNSSHPEGSFLDCATKVASYAGGIPLALEVLGSSLCGQSIEVWISRVEKLKLIGNEDVHSKLRISYDSLDDTEKSLFLDIACFFIGKRKGYVMSILDDCGFFATDGINTLMRRCLVSIGNHSELVMMHDLLRDMGREIVRQESPKDPGERSRIWRHEDVLDVLNDKLGTKAVEGIILNNPGLRQLFSAKTFKKMKRLRLLQLNYVRLTGSCEYISSKLRWICWRKFPYDSIPSDLNLENLVALEMRYGNMEQFFEEENSLKKLKFINLNHSHQLKRTPNFEGFTSLEELMLKDCIRLEEIDESIGLAPSLRILNLQDCKNLKHLPGSICGLRSLLKLNISGCNKLEDLPEELGNLQSLVTLTADETPISTLPETISSLENLQHLSLRGCHSVFSLEKNTPIINFLPSSLKELDLRYCNIVDNMIPDDLRGLPLLQNFKLCGNNFTSLPASVCGLPMLYSLWLNECKRLRSIPQLPSSVNQLQADNCPSLVSIDLTNVHGASAFQFSGCRSLHEIKGFFNFESLRPEVVGALLKNGL